MNLCLLANGPFAVPMFRALCGSAHDVRCVVVRPPQTGRGRHRRPPPSPMHQVAIDLGVEVLAPETVNGDDVRKQLATFAPDLFVVCDYGEILWRETIDMPRLGCINLHGSLLPKYRGAAPVAWAIFHGEVEAGNTVFQITPGVDAGPMLGQQRLAILPDETTDALEARLAEEGASLVVDVVGQIAAGTAQPVEQDASQVIKAPRLKKSDGQIDWTRTAAQIHNQVRAMRPWPRAFAAWQRPSGKLLRLIITQVRTTSLSNHASSARAGEVIEADQRLVLAAGGTSCEAIEIVELQPAGKRAMTAAEFLQGHAVQPGDRFS